MPKSGVITVCVRIKAKVPKITNRSKGSMPQVPGEKKKTRIKGAKKKKILWFGYGSLRAARWDFLGKEESFWFANTSKGVIKWGISKRITATG